MKCRRQDKDKDQFQYMVEYTNLTGEWNWKRYHP